MKPHRVRMANSLVLHYGLHSKLDGVGPTGGGRPLQHGVPGAGRWVLPLRLRPPPGVPAMQPSTPTHPSLAASWCTLARPPQYYTPTRAGAEDMAAFHAEDYVDFLRTVSPDNMVGADGCWRRVLAAPALPAAARRRRRCRCCCGLPGTPPC